MTAVLSPWTPADVAAFGDQVLVLPHRLHERDDLVGDAALVRLLELLPDSARDVYTMGTDPADRGPWRQGTAGTLSGAALLEAVRHGRLWFNLQRLQVHDAAWRAVLDDVVAGLRAQVPGLDVVQASATLLLSSPTAQVHYHADAQPNVLLHCRGRKRLLVWPALDPRFVAHEDLQRIFTGEAHEYLPYSVDDDAHATVVDLAPGMLASWPQNSGHRVANTEGLNVSLSVEYATPASLRRHRVWAANRYLSTRLGLPARSTREDGVWAAGKAASYRALRRVKDLPPRTHSATFTVDPGRPLGVRDLDAPLPLR